MKIRYIVLVLSLLGWSLSVGAQGIWTLLDGDVLSYTENESWRLIDQDSDSQINPGVLIDDGASLVLTVLTNGHNCCSMYHGSGCSEPAIETAVCDLDSFCCMSTWDNLCIGRIQDATAGAHFCPADWESEDLAVDNAGEYGGHPDVNLDCLGGGYLCYKATRIGTQTGGNSGRDPLRIVFLPSLDGGWGYPQINGLVRSLLYRNASDSPDLSIVKSLDLTYTAVDGSSEAGVVSLDMTAVNDPPVVQTNSALTVLEGTSGQLNASRLVATDVDGSSDQIFWTLRHDGAANHGELRLTGSPIFWFRQSHANSGQVTYHHDGSEMTTDLLGLALTDSHNCCVNALGTGCSDSVIEGCVCAADDYCCSTRWDQICVNQVTSLCAATCGADGGPVEFNININPVNDPPMVVTNSPLSVMEGGQAPITNGHLRATDVDNYPSQLRWWIATGGEPEHGNLMLGATPCTSMTQANIDTGMVRYLHDGSEETSDHITFVLDDGGGASAGPVTFNIVVTPMNDPPELAANRILEVATAEERVITTSHLQVVDPDDSPTDLQFIVTASPIHGQLLLDGVDTVTFTQDDIDVGLVSYLNDGGGATSDNFVLYVSDDQGSSISGFTFNIMIGDPIFRDEFESGDTSAWTETVGGDTSGENATGTIWPIDGALLLDGETFTLDDGMGATLDFEFDADGGYFPSATPISFDSFMSVDAVCVSVRDAINGAPDLAISATVGAPDRVDLTNDFVGVAGNQPITETVSHPDFIVDGMSGGLDPTP